MIGGDTIINSKCICLKGLNWNTKKQIMLSPCDHIFHAVCIRGAINCPVCHSEITERSTITDLQLKSRQSRLDYQRYVDMTSVRNFNGMYTREDRQLSKIVDAVGILSLFPFLSGYRDGKKACNEIFSLMNTSIITSGRENIDPRTKKVFISNHTCHFDFIVIFYLIKCGFLSSSYIYESWIGLQIAKIIPLLVIERGNTTNTVDQIHDYVEKHGSICLFPEGMISHPDCMIRFRTGAFHAGFPVQPVVLRYEPVIYDTDLKKLIEKILSTESLKIYIDILPLEQPPFDNHKIEVIRKKMAKKGNFALSRVSNKDISD